MNYPKQIWDQLKSLQSKDLYNALKKDKNWEQVDTVGAEQIFRHIADKDRYVHIHLHPTQKWGYGPKLLKNILNQIKWSEEDLRQLKLIK